MKYIMIVFLMCGTFLWATTDGLIRRTAHDNDDWIIFTKNRYQLYAAHQVSTDIYYAYDTEKDEVCFGPSAQEIWNQLENYFSTSEVVITVEAEEPAFYVAR